MVDHAKSIVHLAGHISQFCPGFHGSPTSSASNLGSVVLCGCIGLQTLDITRAHTF